MAPRGRKLPVMENKSLLDVTALSALWRLHPESIRRLIRAGRLPAVRFGRRLRIGLEAVQAYESSQRVITNNSAHDLAK
jgi:excisionase family DNA binding protein